MALAPRVHPRAAVLEEDFRESAYGAGYELKPGGPTVTSLSFTSVILTFPEVFVKAPA